MSGVVLIERLDLGSERFQRLYKKLSVDVRKEAGPALASLIGVNVLNPAARLHLHPLKNILVASALDPNKKIKVYTFHLTTNDRYKASFTLENGTAYLRACGEHDYVDSKP